MPGAVILDTNALKHLVDDRQRGRLVSSLHAADLELVPSALNVVEVVKSENAQVRTRLLNAIREISGTTQLMPMPSSLLSQVGASIANGRDQGFELERSGLEWVVEHPERVEPRHIADAARILDANQEFWNDRHRAGRSAMREMLKQRGTPDPWGSIPIFLDEQWMPRDQITHFLRLMWTAMKLAGEPPIDALLADGTWRLYFEGMGASIYERCIVSQTLKPVHVADLLHLPYLGGWTKRIFITEDAGLRRVAEAILTGRYRDIRVMTPAQFIASAG
jgi:hypothetical protein